jgi:hypothetical protein
MDRCKTSELRPEQATNVVRTVVVVPVLPLLELVLPGHGLVVVHESGSAKEQDK